MHADQFPFVTTTVCSINNDLWTFVKLTHRYSFCILTRKNLSQNHDSSSKICSVYLKYTWQHHSLGHIKKWFILHKEIKLSKIFSFVYMHDMWRHEIISVLQMGPNQTCTKMNLERTLSLLSGLVWFGWLNHGANQSLLRVNRGSLFLVWFGLESKPNLMTSSVKVNLKKRTRHLVWFALA